MYERASRVRRSVDDFDYYRESETPCDQLKEAGSRTRGGDQPTRHRPWDTASVVDGEQVVSANSGRTVDALRVPARRR